MTGLFLDKQNTTDMKVCYVTEYDATNMQSWSGSGYRIHHHLSLAGAEVKLLGGLQIQKNFRNRLSHKFWRQFQLSYLDDRDPVILRNYARQIEDRLSEYKCDVIFSPGTLPIAYLKTKLPVVFWTDATFANLLNYYGHFSNLSPVSVRHGHEAERRALAQASLAVYTSDWAAKSAIREYGANPEKIRIIPFGANLDRFPTQEEVSSIITTRDRTECRLLFVGVDWKRKGGSKALEIAQNIESLGQKVRLDIVGPKQLEGLPKFAIHHGFLKKDNLQDKAQLEQLFQKAHFFLLPTQADCVPVVFAEANIHGVPVIAPDTGGVSSVIANGRNGFLFPPNVSASVVAHSIVTSFSDEIGYNILCLQSWLHVAETQNWDRSVKLLIRELEDIVK